VLGCDEKQCAAVEFHLAHTYQVRLNRKTIVVDESDSETIRREINGQWQPLGPPNVQNNRIILERKTGKILRTPGLGVSKSTVNSRGRRKGRRRLSVLAGTA
jgi:hypothetical protein